MCHAVKRQNDIAICAQGVHSVHMKSFRETDVKVRLRVDMKRAMQRIADSRCEKLSVVMREAVKMYLDEHAPTWQQAKRKAA